MFKNIKLVAGPKDVITGAFQGVLVKRGESVKVSDIVGIKLLATTHKKDDEEINNWEELPQNAVTTHNFYVEPKKVAKVVEEADEEPTRTRPAVRSQRTRATA